VSRLLAAFASSAASAAATSAFTSAQEELVADMLRLHGECKRLQEAAPGRTADTSIPQEIAAAEAQMLAQVQAAIASCEPLCVLVQKGSVAFAREMQNHVQAFLMTFSGICYSYAGGADGFAASAVSAAAKTLVRTSSPAASPAPSPRPKDDTAKGISTSAEALLHEVNSLEWVGMFALALARIGRRLDDKSVAKIWAAAADLFGSDASARQELAPSTASEAARAVQEAAQAVVSHFVAVSGQRLGHFFRNSVQRCKWMTLKEAKEPSLVVEMVLKEVSTYDAQLARFFEDPRKTRSAASHARRSYWSKNSMELEMERLWARKLQVFAAVSLSRQGAIVGILRIAFKALCEYVREETMCQFGLHQVQVDCAILSEGVRDFVGDAEDDAGLLDSLLGEVVNCATQRCVDPRPLDAAAVEVICEEKRKELRQ